MYKKLEFAYRLLRKPNSKPHIIFNAHRGALALIICHFQGEKDVNSGPNFQEIICSRNKMLTYSGHYQLGLVISKQDSKVSDL